MTSSEGGRNERVGASKRSMLLRRLAWRDPGEIGTLLFQQTGVKLRINVNLSNEGNQGNRKGTFLIVSK